jgi:hypothetical protein
MFSIEGRPVLVCSMGRVGRARIGAGIAGGRCWGRRWRLGFWSFETQQFPIVSIVLS